MINETQARLDAIAELILEANKEEMLLSTFKLLRKILEVTSEDKPLLPLTHVPLKDRVVITCYGEPHYIKDIAGIGIVIEDRQKPPFTTWRTVKKFCTKNQATYHSIYLALTQFAGLHNNPGCSVEVRVSNKTVVESLNLGLDEKDINLCSLILELVKVFPFPVSFVWRPENSSVALEEATNLAQKIIN